MNAFKSIRPARSFMLSANTAANVNGSRCGIDVETLGLPECMYVPDTPRILAWILLHSQSDSSLHYTSSSTASRCCSGQVHGLGLMVG
jgi:hypothetical protein